MRRSVGLWGRRRSRCAFVVAISALLVSVAPGAAGDVAEKTGLEAAVASRADLLWDAARKVWDWAEPGYQETKSSALLASIVEEEGFSVERGVAGIPTSFVASYGSGGPIIAILAEFDALPGLSQEAVPTRSPREGPDWGHACGHHLFGAGSVGAALAVADGIRSGAIRGTVRLFGTPAEEGGGAKAFMARAGLFDDVDAVLHWHPGDVNSAGDPTNLARVAAKFRYRGRSAHAAASPEAGRSALDAVAILNYGAELLREHTPDRTRIHHVITAGGDAPNVVPAFAEAYYYVRHPDIDIARSIYDRLVLVAEGAAHATETELEIEFLGGIHNLLPNDTLSEISHSNFKALIDMKYTDEERGWAR
ncbi:MAG: amidohydrolase, partial [Acidobacteria bacterium]|nr:amidohydrolase [Acidobacteriota bacterium]